MVSKRQRQKRAARLADALTQVTTLQTELLFSGLRLRLLHENKSQWLIHLPGGTEVLTYWPARGVARRGTTKEVVSCRTIQRALKLAQEEQRLIHQPPEDPWVTRHPDEQPRHSLGWGRLVPETQLQQLLRMAGPALFRRLHKEFTELSREDVERMIAVEFADG